MGKCIWCEKINFDVDVEHIIPEALGCPDNFVLSNGLVCRTCNNNLAHLDRAVIDDFDIAAFWAGVPRKKGRKPFVRSRGNLVAGYNGNEKFIAINNGRKEVIGPSGTKIAPYAGKKRHIKSKKRDVGSQVEVSFSSELGSNKKFRRGIYKIAISSLAYFLGPAKAGNQELHSAKKFVQKGKEDRAILFRKCEDQKYMNRVWAPYVNKEGHYSIVLRIAAVEMVADLSPASTIFPLLKKQSEQRWGDKDWTYVPTNA